MNYKQARNAAESPEASSQRFSFEKTKGFSYLTYKTVNTDVILVERDLVIESRTEWFLVFKGTQKRTVIPLEEIISISTRRTWDFWDLFFAVFILIASRINHWLWLLLVLLFVYTAAGHCIEICLKNGQKMTIPYSSFSKNDEFISVLQGYIDSKGLY